MVLSVVQLVLRVVQNNIRFAVEEPPVVALRIFQCVVFLERPKPIAVVLHHLFVLVDNIVVPWIQMSNQCWEKLTKPINMK